MNLKYILAFVSLTMALPCFKATAQAPTEAPAVLWQRTLGGDGIDILSGVQALSGGGVMLAGYSNSGISGNKKDSSRGATDFWVIKLDEKGNIAWEKTYGGLLDDSCAQIIKTNDGGYLLGGTTLSPRSGDKIQGTWGFSPDYWVIKLDRNGTVLWQRDLGGNYAERLVSMGETDYGYSIAGYSCSNVSGDKEEDNTGSENRADFWLVSLEKTGKTKKTAVYGTVGQDQASCIVSSNSGSVIGGSTFSRAALGQKTANPFGNGDYWVVRTDLGGTRIYDSTMGGIYSDYMTCLSSTYDGKVILGGYSNSPEGGSKTTPFKGATDYWAIKMNIDGSVNWQKTFGGTGADYMMSAKPTRDGGFIIGGYSTTDINGDKTEASRGGEDYWIVKTDSLGNKQWDKTFGGSGNDRLVSVDELADGEYVVSGTSNSPKSGDKDTGTVGNTGKDDYWIIRLGKVVDTTTQPPTDTTVQPPTDTTIVKGKNAMAVTPNPAKTYINIRFSTDVAGSIPFVMYSYDGKKVMSFKVNGTEEPQTHKLYINNLAKGIYYLTMYNRGKPITQMVIKQ